MIGRRDDARKLFEKLLALCNDVGLLSEEYDPQLRHMLGNFPQALTHVAIVNTAITLQRARAEEDKKLERGTEIVRQTFAAKA